MLLKIWLIIIWEILTQASQFKLGSICIKFSDSEIFLEEVLDSVDNVDVVCDDKLDELQHLDDDRETFLKIPTCTTAFKTDSINSMGNDEKINNKPRDVFRMNNNSASTPVFSRVSAFHTYASSLEYGTCEKVMKL